MVPTSFPEQHFAFEAPTPETYDEEDALDWN